MWKTLLITLFSFVTGTVVAAPGDLSIAAENPSPEEGTHYGFSMATQGNNFWIVRNATFTEPTTRIYKYEEPGSTGNLYKNLSNWMGLTRGPAIHANEGKLAFHHVDSPSNQVDAFTAFEQGSGVALGTASNPTGKYGSSSIVIFGGQMLVGNGEDTVGGQVHVFSLLGTYQQTLFNPKLSAGRAFGNQMGIASHNRLAILDRLRGLYVYDENLSRTLELYEPSGADFRTMATGSDCVAFSDNAGSKVTIYNVQLNFKVRDIPKPTSSTGIFGETLAISGDIIAIGLPSATVDTVSEVGLIRLYRISTGEFITEVRNPLMDTNPALAEYSEFGRYIIPYKGSFLVGFHKWSPDFNNRFVGRIYHLDGEALSEVDFWERY